MGPWPLKPSSWRPLARSKLLLCALALSACTEKRKPIARGDAGPSVVVLDGRTVDLGALPSSPEREPNDTVAQAETLNGRIAGTLPATPKPDVDFYRVQSTLPPDLDASVVVPVATIVLRNGAQPVVLDVLDEKGKVVLSRDAAANAMARVTSLRMDLGGLLRVRRGSKASGDCDYTLDAITRIAQADEELEPNDDPKRANALPESGAFSGVFDPGDRDSLALPLVNGAWRIELASLPDVQVELKMKRGEQTVFTTRGSKGGELRLRNAPSGEGLVLQARAVDGSSDQPYSLHITSEPPLDVQMDKEPNDDLGHAQQVKAGEIVGYLWPSDVDRYCVDAPGITARVEGIADADFILELFDNAGHSLGKADEGKRGSAETLSNDRASCVKLSAHGRDTVFDAPYRLSLTATGSTQPTTQP
jgi:hypothetical protein